jgi:hypothetical protein
MTMTEAERGDREDLPTIIASVIATAPPLVLKIGLGYLRMKRRVRKSARVMERELMASGMPEHIARRLSMRYEEDSRFIEIAMKALRGKGAFWKCSASADNQTGN